MGSGDESWAGADRRRGNNEAMARADEAMLVAREAKQEAGAAAHHVERHEDRCEERWKAANDTMRRVETGFDAFKVEIKRDIAALYGRWWLIMIAIIAGLIGIIGALLARYVLP